MIKIAHSVGGREIKTYLEARNKLFTCLHDGHILLQ